MNKTQNPQLEIPYQSPEKRPRPHPLAVISFSATLFSALIYPLYLLARTSGLPLPRWMYYNDEAIAVAAGFALLATLLAAIARRLVQSDRRKRNGARIATASLIIASAQFFLSGITIFYLMTTFNFKIND